MRWWDRRLQQKVHTMSKPPSRLIRFGACAILASILMFIVLVAVSARANIPPNEPPAQSTENAPPTCQDFASEAKAIRIESWRRLFWDGLATSGAPKHAIACAIDHDRVNAFDDALEVGCKSGGAFPEVFIAEMNRHLVPCGFELQRRQ